MVEFVDELLPPLTKDEVFVFKVYKSPKDGEIVLVLELAEGHGAKAVLINEPDKLFPNQARP